MWAGLINGDANGEQTLAGISSLALNLYVRKKHGQTRTCNPNLRCMECWRNGWWDSRNIRCYWLIGPISTRGDAIRYYTCHWSEWISVNSLHSQASATPRALGEVRLARSQAMSANW